MVEKEETIAIPLFLKPVNQNHLPFFKGYRMYCPAIGNGACGTNCASIHMMEDDSQEAMIKMKSKSTHHIADHYENIYKNIIFLIFPYMHSPMAPGSLSGGKQLFQ